MQVLSTTFLTQSGVDIPKCREYVIKKIIFMLNTINGIQVPSDPEAQSFLVDGWQYALAEVYLGHLQPLFRHVLSTKSDNYKIELKDLLAAWNTRYDDDSSRPPAGMSWERDANGRFTISNKQTNGRWPWDAPTREKAVELNKQARLEWENKMLMNFGNELPLDQQLTIIKNWV